MAARATSIHDECCSHPRRQLPFLRLLHGSDMSRSLFTTGLCVCWTCLYYVTLTDISVAMKTTVLTQAGRSICSQTPSLLVTVSR